MRHPITPCCRWPRPKPSSQRQLFVPDSGDEGITAVSIVHAVPTDVKTNRVYIPVKNLLDPGRVYSDRDIEDSLKALSASAERLGLRFNQEI